MSDPQFEPMLAQFRQALSDCRQLYVSAGRLVASEHADLLERTPQNFVQLMDDLHRGLLIKLYISIAEADQRWTHAEKLLAEVLVQHVWGQQLSGAQLREAVLHLSQKAASLKWYSLIRPFDRVEPLRERIAELETIVLRVANIVAKCDGQPTPPELHAVQTVQTEISLNLHPLPVDDRAEQETTTAAGSQAVQTIEQDSKQVHEQFELKDDIEPLSPDDAPREERLAEALKQLEELIGMDNVKQEVRTMVNFLKLQKQREQAGLPQTQISLHLVFGGNPGTGKTTVARIVGKLYGAMGVLDKGHLIETDRSGLVAEYAGQTAPKTNKTVDEALDGVLFIDEAYSLVAERGDDAFGHEAIQTLLKRMEDDRQRLVVILAGYPEPMQRLLRANPGLSSRFTHHLNFEDYTSGQLGRIFGAMCEKNHYEIAADTQAKVLLGFQWLYDHRDEHFGNGRMVRNAFERAIRRLANRIVGIPKLTKELLTTLDAEDIDLSGVPASHWELLTSNGLAFAIRCPQCANDSKIPANFLGRRVKCKKCDHRFVASWGEPSP